MEEKGAAVSVPNGWLPDDGMKEAAQKAYDAAYQETYNGPVRSLAHWNGIEAALVAARRYQSERDASCHHDWYRGPDSPPDTCLKCGARKDNG